MTLPIRLSAPGSGTGEIPSVLTRWAGLLLAVGALSVSGQTTALFIDNTNYWRTGVTFWATNADPNPYPLYLDGVLQSQEGGGSASIDWLGWPCFRPVLVGICDNAHGISLDVILTNICPAAVPFHAAPDADGIRDCISNGCLIIVCPFFTAQEGEPVTDLSNACYEASQANVEMICSVPDNPSYIDSASTPAYPPSWNLPGCIAVTASMRQDYVYGAAAVGQWVIAAPGRIVLTRLPDGYTPAYATGTSYAAPILAGAFAWFLSQFNQTHAAIEQAIRAGSVPIDNRIQGRLSMAGALESLRPTVTITNGPEAHGIGQYQIEHSDDLIQWQDSDGSETEGFFRAKIK